MTEAFQASQYASIARTSSAPPTTFSASSYRRMKEGLDDKRELSEEEQTGEIIRRMKAVRADLSSTLGSCQKTLETTSCTLKEHFQHLPSHQLGQHIALRFSYFDKDKSGVLDRGEVKEAMAEMGQRPSDEELDELFQLIDKNHDDKVDEKEFENLVRLKLKLICPESITSAHEEANHGEGDQEEAPGKGSSALRATRTASLPSSLPSHAAKRR